MVKNEIKFEDKIKELEKIITELESGEIDLDSSIEKYTYAMKLVKECDNKLKSVEDKITKILTEDQNLKDFEIEE